jgi:hypothetical protein
MCWRLYCGLSANIFSLIDYVTWKAMAVIPCTLPSPPQDSSDFSLNHDYSYMQQFPAEDLPLTPPNAPNESEKMHTALPSAPPPLPGQVQVPPLREFIANLVRKSRLHTGTFLATLVYLERLRSKLYSVAKGKNQQFRAPLFVSEAQI